MKETDKKMPIIGQKKNRHGALQREHLRAQGKFLKQSTHAKEGFPEMMIELHMEVRLRDRCTWRAEAGYFRTANSRV